MRDDEISEHCLCDKCSGQDCELFKRDDKEHDIEIRKQEHERVLERCMGFSINNENPGWVRIADIKSALFGENWPNADELQESLRAQGGDR